MAEYRTCPVTRNSSQVAVIGAGAAGLYTALCAARRGAAVTLVSATPLAGASSYWAQGGLAAALADGDSPELHLRDTITAGRGCVRGSAARVLVQEAPQAVADLIELGVRFDPDRSGELSLGLEGGHSQRRIVHAGGAATGRRIIRQLSAVAAQHPRIEVIERRSVVRILTDADGRIAALRLDDRTVIEVAAVVVATGGAAAMWARTTNPSGATGGGLRARPRRRRPARRPRVDAVPPHRGRRRQRRRRVPGHRGGPRRGRSSARRRRGAVRRRARAAR